MLQLGAKYYGVHLGPSVVPQEESDPRVLLEPNFYYDQEDVLKKFCEEHGSGWNTTRPSWVPGAAPDAAMNLVYPLAIYATVQKHLGKPLVFPGDLACWENATVLSSAMMNCYLAEWAALTENATNKSFNATDDSPFAWGKFWPKYAAHFNMPWEGPEHRQDTEFRTEKTPFDPPPRGWGPVGTSRFSFKLTEWAKNPEVTAAWSEIAERNNLRSKDLGDVDRIFGFTDAALLSAWPTIFSNTELRKTGFFGFVDSTESILSTLDEFSKLKMIPEHKST